MKLCRSGLVRRWRHRLLVVEDPDDQRSCELGDLVADWLLGELFEQVDDDECLGLGEYRQARCVRRCVELGRELGREVVGSSVAAAAFDRA